MTVNDPGKLLLLMVGLIGGFIMWALGEIFGAAVVIYVLGYLTGNGRLAARREAPSTALSPVLGTGALEVALDRLLQRVHSELEELEALPAGELEELEELEGGPP